MAERKAMEKGQAKGRAEGRVEGRTEEKQEIVRSLKRMGLSAENIQKATGLSIEDIDAL